MLAEEDPISLDKSKVVDNATNMTQLSLSFEITEIEVHIAQVCIFNFILSVYFIAYIT